MSADFASKWRCTFAYRWFCKLDLDDKVPHHSAQPLL
jgi:hypothetical protein